MINILKASAGSGKTYRLAKTYIELLLRSNDRHAYRHILAVTFTNKATSEMKSRILKELNILATTPTKSNYYESFTKEFGPASKIQEKAQRILEEILHDYSAFSISTIDRFFQQTLKAFAREIGQFASYQVELDKESLVRESVDRVLDSITESNTEMISWLKESVVNGLVNKESFSLDKSLYNMASSLMSDDFRNLAEEQEVDVNYLFSSERLGRIMDTCKKVMENFESEVKDTSRKISGILASNDISPDIFHNRMMIKIVGYADIRGRINNPLTTAVIARINDDEEGWIPKSKRAALGDIILPDEFVDSVRYLAKIFLTSFVDYLTAQIISDQLYSFGIAIQLQQQFAALLKEKNVLSLDDSNFLLRKIIGDSDAPFVYEKLGVRYENFLLDEFQDTSVVQWNNFRPLLKESNANGHTNLIVGDVKQSIYRWRMSDWTLLEYEIQNAFPDSNEESLVCNFRSYRSVVDFNNKFFKYIVKRCDRQLDIIGIEPMYSDVEQKVEKKGGEGHIQFSFCPAANEIEEVVLSVKKAHSQLGGYRGIAVIIRKNASGAAIAAELAKHNIPVVSDDSLSVKSSVIVNSLFSMLCFVNNQTNKIYSYLAERINFEIPDGWKSIVELCESLVRSLKQNYPPQMFADESLYIQAFMDYVIEWTSINGNILQGLIANWQTTELSISSPESADAVRIITIHKSKGLEFPYVIFPFAEHLSVSAKGMDKPSWVAADFSKSKALEDIEGIYSVRLSSLCENTLFNEQYQEEKIFKYIDNINLLYVALTRAGKCLHVISESEGSNKKDGTFTNLAQPLYDYLKESGMGKVSDKEAAMRAYDYVSYVSGDFAGLGRNDVLEEVKDEDAFGYPSYESPGRLRVRNDAKDYFSEEGEAGKSLSARINGIVFHNVLSKVIGEKDILDAVRSAADDGDIEASEVEYYAATLKRKIESCSAYGWFDCSAAEIRNEADIVDTKGSVHRPDRVVIRDGVVCVIDYKFGKEEGKYLKQVREYINLYKDMGYRTVKGYLWYVMGDKIIEV